ncbi:hypothetical protein [Dehalogenimonas etheniformans]|uniref:Methyltransferase type 11 domain-containing protein n=1 Tax=Dehalogenimonas etheniformans TaxID=1536648 RepID=A0A2P5P4U5_9CHLR|nr:hypothetical protein [Dehalogenimonas etheniformans]PPD57316.1 hypothetical protein JP09_009735 [Dehalogenimonas etheniformans]QNT77034.1 hypothetical protein HX448_10285 [Dehalogenimonas etheniformans]
MDEELVKKLLFKREYQAAILNAPPDYLDRIGIPVMDDISIKASLDFIQVFVTGKLEFLLQLPKILRALKPGGLLWIAYSANNSRMPADVNRYILWAEMAKFGMAGIAMISIDDTWSAMRFQPVGKPKR